MELKRYLDLVGEGKATRRDFLKAATTAGLVTTMMPMIPKLARAAGEVLYFTWAGYDVPELHQAYIEKYGGSPETTLFAAEAEALNKLRAGFKVDLVHPCVEVANRWREAGVIKAIDTSRLANWGDVFPQLKTMEGVSHGGETFICPTDWGNNSVAYRTDLVELEGEESYWLLFDERYAGRIAAQDSTPVVTMAMLALGIEEPWNSTDEEIAKAKELLMKQRDLVRFYWESPSEVIQAMGSGEVVVASCWNDVPAALKRNGVPVRYMNPKEGIIIWGCGVSLSSNGEGDEQAAYDFIDAMLDPRTGKFFIEEYGYGHSNRKSYDLVAEDKLEELNIKNPSELFTKGIWYQEPSEEIQIKQTRMWEEVRAGL